MSDFETIELNIGTFKDGKKIENEIEYLSKNQDIFDLDAYAQRGLAGIRHTVYEIGRQLQTLADRCIIQSGYNATDGQGYKLEGKIEDLKTIMETIQKIEKKWNDNKANPYQAAYAEILNGISKDDGGLQ